MSKALTPADIRNPKLKSGYSHVGSANAGRNGHGQKHDLWRGETSPGKPPRWRGPARRDPAVAAQDYCDYMNGKQIKPPRATLPTVVHKRPKRRKRPVAPDTVQEARQTIRSWQEELEAADPRQNYIYLIGVVGDRYAVKVGEARSPELRMIEGQTWNARPLVLLGYVKTDIRKDADKIEAHPKMVRFHVNGEWFRPAAEVLSYFDVSPTTYLRKTAEQRQTRRAA